MYILEFMQGAEVQLVKRVARYSLVNKVINKILPLFTAVRITKGK